MVYRRYVQPGRVAVINYGKDYGKVVIIVDILDNKKVLVDGPTTGFPRTLYPISRLNLTKYKINILRGARTGTVKKVALEAKLNETWEGSSIAKKLVISEKRSNLNDLDRFKVMVARKQRSFKVRALAKKMLGGGKGGKGKPAGKAPAKGKKGK